MSSPSRRFFAPEVVQTSAMDCGPATLKCLLDGFGIPVSYGRLREACQTDVDGTSVDTLEDIAGQLGLEAEQTVLPVDHLLLDEAGALPALVVVRFPNGLTHFVVCWRRHGPVLQLMDPATGRRWVSGKTFLEDVYLHEVPIPAASWREWAAGREFAGALERRLSNLRVPRALAERLVGAAREDPGWRTFAVLDAATRMVDTLVQARAIRPGAEAARAIETFLGRTAAAPSGEDAVPKHYWSARPGPPDSDGNEQLLLRGAVLVRILGRKQPEAGGEASAARTETTGAENDPAPAVATTQKLSPELVAALSETPASPARELWRWLKADGLLLPGALLGALLLAAGAVVFEAVLFRGLFDLGRDLTVSGQRLGAMLAVLAFATVLLLLELPLAGMVLRFGRRLEIRMRIAFLEKIPRLVDRYFQSRLTSDMAERCHMVQTLRALPDLGTRFLRAAFELLFTVAGIVWLDPASTPIVLLAAVAALGLPLLTNPLLTERDLRLRTHVGALARFYLDALLGLVPIRSHGAERAVRSEHESLLVEWVRAGFSLQRAAVAVEGVQGFLGVGLAVWLLFNYVARNPDAGGVLLLVYWALNLPFLAEQLALLVRQYPAQRSVTLRLLEPLGAPEDSGPVSGNNGPVGPIVPSEEQTEMHLGPASITLSSVCVRAAGHSILEEIDVRISPGEHVAIVGPSGAGKSTFVGLLLGWHRPASGELLVDGLPLDTRRLEQLRRYTAWVDPAVQLWNSSLLENLSYGTDNHGASRISWVLHQADLLRVLQNLPDGLQTRIGEGGGLVSGGEGQRVRFGRGLLRDETRLVILDEPFRGLDRDRRREMLERARARWQGVTLLCITHDVGETLPFGRVLVIERGRLVEDDAPAVLAAKPGSRYAALLEAEQQVRRQLWTGADWRRQRLEGGRLVEAAAAAEVGI